MTLVKKGHGKMERWDVILNKHNKKEITKDVEVRETTFKTDAVEAYLYGLQRAKDLTNKNFEYELFGVEKANGKL